MKEHKSGSKDPAPIFEGRGETLAAALDDAAANAIAGDVPDGTILTLFRVQVRVENPHVGEYFVHVG
jgi:hypothetical protein